MAAAARQDGELCGPVRSLSASHALASVPFPRVCYLPQLYCSGTYQLAPGHQVSGPASASVGPPPNLPIPVDQAQDLRYRELELSASLGIPPLFATHRHFHISGRHTFPHLRVMVWLGGWTHSPSCGHVSTLLILWKCPPTTKLVSSVSSCRKGNRQVPSAIIAWP